VLFNPHTAQRTYSMRKSKLDKMALAEQQKVNALQADSSATGATASQNESNQP